MKPFVLIAHALSPDGTLIQLKRRDDEFVIFAAGRHLMSSRTHASEKSLAAFGCRRFAAQPESNLASSPPRKSHPEISRPNPSQPKISQHNIQPNILIGGLGMGYTLRAALDLLPPRATVVVAELIPEIVDWNRGPLAHLAGHPLADPRVRIEITDVAALLSPSAQAAQRPPTFDAILLDTDNGPGAFTDSANSALYSTHGIAAAHASLNPGGTLAIWSAYQDRQFERRLRAANFTLHIEHTRAHANHKGPRHTIYLAQKSIL